MLTTNQLGLVAETCIALECLRLGVGVSRPLDDERYDLILDLRPKLLRVQCKWATRKGDVVAIRCRGCRRSAEGLVHRYYAAGEIDAIAAFCAGTDCSYLLPEELSVARASVQLRLGETRNNQRAGINWAHDYELGATLRRLQGP